jgi:hypothetical protein
MLMPSDKDYQQTKRIKQEGTRLQAPFAELADWICTNYDVAVINVIYDTVIPDSRPRLSVVLELDADLVKFRENPLGNFKRSDQQRIASEFERILADYPKARFTTDGLLVVFNSFEAVARIEVNESVPDEEISKLKRHINNTELWEISRCFDGVTFLFFTDKQFNRAKKEGVCESYALEYSRMVERYDEFEYLKRSGLAFSFDSKENFDANYEGNWFYYYR